MKLNRILAYVMIFPILILGISNITYADEPTGFTVSESGCKSVQKLSKGDICKILQKAYPAISEELLYDKMPSDIAPYAPGKLKNKYVDAATKRLNILRQIAGLHPVKADYELSEETQYGSTILSAIDELTHAPWPKPDMSVEFYKKAARAAAKSNIFYSSYNSSLEESVDSFMDDSDYSNISMLGHRRWQLNPHMGKVGFGKTGSYIAEWVIDNSNDHSDYDFISWPPSGNFPGDGTFFNNMTAWSVTLNPDRYIHPDISTVKVKLERLSDGRVWKFSKETLYPVTNSLYYNINSQGYGVKNCIIFRPGNISTYEGDYNVEITGLKDSTGMDARINYKVHFFNQREYPFKDVTADKYYFEPIIWAVENGITYQTTPEFKPNVPCVRSQGLSYIWRAEKKPEVTKDIQFLDISQNAYYRKAVAWAIDKGVTSGTSATHFSPDMPCTRAQILTLLWRASGSPISSADPRQFKDVKSSDYFYNAVAWAVGKGITGGTSQYTFSPNDPCTKAQILTFLYRNYYS